MSTMSPELALVDPELRAYAIELLPTVRPYAFLELRTLVVDIPVVPAPARTSYASAALAYLAVAIMRTLAFDAVVFVSIAVCVLLANLFA
jgi:hypothetical protein